MTDQRPEDWWPYRGPGSRPGEQGPAEEAGAPTQELPPVIDGPTEVLPGVGPDPTLVMQPQPGPPNPPAVAPVPPQWSSPGGHLRPAHWAAPQSAPPQWAPPQSAPRQWAPPPPQQRTAQYPPPTQRPWPQQYPAPVRRLPPHQYPPPAGPPVQVNGWAAQPAPRPPRRTGRTAAVLALFVVLGVVAGIAVMNLLDRGPTSAPVVAPTTSVDPTANSSPTTRPTPSTSPPPSVVHTPYQVPPTTWPELPTPTPTSRAHRVVVANALYQQDFPVATACPTVSDEIVLNTQFRRVSQEILNCQHVAWQAIFEHLGWDLAKPRLFTFHGAVDTACGRVSDEQSFYCPATATIYLSEQRFESSLDWWRLHFVNTVVHEYLHHVQASAGVIDAAYDLDMDDDERTRRVELQAYCMTSRMMLITPGFAFGADDYLILKQWTAEGEGSETHGSVASRQHWWMRGLEQQTPAGCNTWAVAADQVT